VPHDKTEEGVYMPNFTVCTHIHAGQVPEEAPGIKWLRYTYVHACMHKPT
jgi:hypothetical protein